MADVDKVVTGAPCGVAASFSRLIGDLNGISIQVSTTSNPGDGGHQTFFYGSPTAERAAIEFVRFKVLQWLGQRQVPSTQVAYHQMLNDLQAFISTLALSDQEVYAGISDPSQWICNGHFRAPTSTALAAMRRSVQTVVQTHILESLMSG